MTNTPNQRSMRSTSNQNMQATLLEIKTLIEKSKKDMLQVLEDKIDNQTKMIDCLVQRVDELTKVNSSLKKKNQILEEKMENLSSSLMEEIEDRNRRKRNVIISGIPEQGNGDADERKKADMKNVEELMQQLSLCEYKNTIIRTNRIGKPGKDAGNRLLIVTFRDQDVQQDVIRKAKQLRNMAAYRKTFINPDLTPTQRNERKNLNQELRRRRNLGDEVVIWKGKVTEKSKLQNFH